MKTAIYIEQGLTQFVLTPETDIDRKVIEQLESGQGLETYRGSFYECRGGWVRQKAAYRNFSYGLEADADSSLIFVIKPKPPVPDPEPLTDVIQPQL